jgi:hypothetical protein
LLSATPGQGQGARTAIVPFRGREKVPQHEWISVGEPGSEGLLPAWAPSGELIFYIATSHSDPSTSILTAQRFHPEIGKLEGRPFEVYRFDEPSLPLLKLPLNNRLAISPGQIILASAASKGDLWLTEDRK